MNRFYILGAKEGARTLDIHAAWVWRVLRGAGGGDDGDGHGHLLQPHVPRAPQVVVVGRPATRRPAPMQPGMKEEGGGKMDGAHRDTVGPGGPKGRRIRWEWRPLRAGSEGFIHQLDHGDPTRIPL